MNNIKVGPFKYQYTHGDVHPINDDLLCVENLRIYSHGKEIPKEDNPLLYAEVEIKIVDKFFFG